MVQEPVIEIDVALKGSDLFLSVKNKIASGRSTSDSVGSGIGLKNINRRLELLYPKTHQLTITRENGWFLVTLRLNLTA